MNIQYETLYNVAIDKLQMCEIENIKLKALCLEYQKEINELHSKIEKLNNVNDKESNRKE